MDKPFANRPLVEKLGIKEGMKVLFVNPPLDFSKLLTNLPQKLQIDSVSYDNIPSTHLLYDDIHVFAQSHEKLQEIFPQLKNLLTPSGMFWISWPKGQGNIPSHLHEHSVRQIGLQGGLVDTKIVSVDTTWSALKFVYRLADRG